MTDCRLGRCLTSIIIGLVERTVTGLTRATFGAAVPNACARSKFSCTYKTYPGLPFTGSSKREKSKARGPVNGNGASGELELFLPSPRGELDGRRRRCLLLARKINPVGAIPTASNGRQRPSMVSKNALKPVRQRKPLILLVLATSVGDASLIDASDRRLLASLKIKTLPPRQGTGRAQGKDRAP